MDRQAGGTADALKRWSDKLTLSAGDLDTLSPLAKEAKAATAKAFKDLTRAFDQLERLFDQEARVRQAALNRRRDLENTVTRTEDQIAKMLGSEGPSRAELVSRRQRSVALASGGFGVQADPAQAAAALLSRKNLLLQQRRDLTARIDASEKTGQAAVQQREERSRINEGINKLTDGLKELRDAMGKELANSIRELQRTIQQQLQAEQGIATLADAAAAMASGTMSGFDFEKQFGPVLRGVEKLDAGGRVADLSFDENRAIVKALRSGDPLVAGQLRGIAERESNRLLRTTGKAGDVGQILQQLRNELARNLGVQTARFFGATGIGLGERAANRLVGEANPAGRFAARARVEEQLEAQRRVNMEYDAAQRAFSGMMLFNAGRAFGAAVVAFRAAVANFENKVGGMPAPGQAQNNAQGGVVYANIGGMFQPKGTDTVPAMLTPGEFVMKKSSVDSIGVKNLKKMNETGTMYAAEGALVGGGQLSPGGKAVLRFGVHERQRWVDMLNAGQTIPEGSTYRTGANTYHKWRGGKTGGWGSVQTGAERLLGPLPLGVSPQLAPLEQGAIAPTGGRMARRRPITLSETKRPARPAGARGRPDTRLAGSSGMIGGGLEAGAVAPREPLDAVPLPTPRPGQYPPSAGPFDAPPAPPGPRTMTRGERGAPPASKEWADFFPARPGDPKKELHPAGVPMHGGLIPPPGGGWPEARIMAPTNLFPGAPVTAKASKPTPRTVAELKQERDLEQRKVDDRHKFMSSPLQTADLEMIQAEQEGPDAVEALKRKRKAAAAKAVQDQKNLEKELNEKRSPGLQTLTPAEAQARWGSAGSPASQRTAARGRDQFGTLVWDIEGGETREEFDKRLKRDRARLQRQKRTDEVVKAISDPRRESDLDPFNAETDFQREWREVVVEGKGAAVPSSGSELKPRWQRDEEEKKAKTAAYVANIKRMRDKAQEAKERRERILAMGRPGGKKKKRKPLSPERKAAIDARKAKRRDERRQSPAFLRGKAKRLQRLERINAARAKRGESPLEADEFGRPIPDAKAKRYRERQTLHEKTTSAHPHGKPVAYEAALAKDLAEAKKRGDYEAVNRISHQIAQQHRDETRASDVKQQKAAEEEAAKAQANEVARLARVKETENLEAKKKAWLAKYMELARYIHGSDEYRAKVRTARGYGEADPDNPQLMAGSEDIRWGSAADFWDWSSLDGSDGFERDVIDPFVEKYNKQADVDLAPVESRDSEWKAIQEVHEKLRKLEANPPSGRSESTRVVIPKDEAKQTPWMKWAIKEGKINPESDAMDDDIAHELRTTYWEIEKKRNEAKAAAAKTAAEKAAAEEAAKAAGEAAKRRQTDEAVKNLLLTPDSPATGGVAEVDHRRVPIIPPSATDLPMLPTPTGDAIPRTRGQGGNLFDFIAGPMLESIGLNEEEEKKNRAILEKIKKDAEEAGEDPAAIQTIWMSFLTSLSGTGRRGRQTGGLGDAKRKGIRVGDAGKMKDERYNVTGPGGLLDVGSGAWATRYTAGSLAAYLGTAIEKSQGTVPDVAYDEIAGVVSKRMTEEPTFLEELLLNPEVLASLPSAVSGLIRGGAKIPAMILRDTIKETIRKNPKFAMKLAKLHDKIPEAARSGQRMTGRAAQTANLLSAEQKAAQTAADAAATAAQKAKAVKEGRKLENLRTGQTVKAKGAATPAASTATRGLSAPTEASMGPALKNLWNKAFGKGPVDKGAWTRWREFRKAQIAKRKEAATFRWSLNEPGSVGVLDDGTRAMGTGVYEFEVEIATAGGRRQVVTERVQADSWEAAQDLIRARDGVVTPTSRRRVISDVYPVHEKGTPPLLNRAATGTKDYAKNLVDDWKAWRKATADTKTGAKATSAAADDATAYTKMLADDATASRRASDLVTRREAGRTATPQKVDDRFFDDMVTDIIEGPGGAARQRAQRKVESLQTQTGQVSGQAGHSVRGTVGPTTVVQDIPYHTSSIGGIEPVAGTEGLAPSIAQSRIPVRPGATQQPGTSAMQTAPVMFEGTTLQIPSQALPVNPLSPRGRVGGAAGLGLGIPSRGQVPGAALRTQQSTIIGTHTGGPRVTQLELPGGGRPILAHPDAPPVGVTPGPSASAQATDLALQQRVVGSGPGPGQAGLVDLTAASIAQDKALADAALQTRTSTGLQIRQPGAARQPLTGMFDVPETPLAGQVVSRQTNTPATPFRRLHDPHARGDFGVAQSWRPWDAIATHRTPELMVSGRGVGIQSPLDLQPGFASGSPQQRFGAGIFGQVDPRMELPGHSGLFGATRLGRAPGGPGVRIPSGRMRGAATRQVSIRTRGAQQPVGGILSDAIRASQIKTGQGLLGKSNQAARAAWVRSVQGKLPSGWKSMGAEGQRAYISNVMRGLGAPSPAPGALRGGLNRGGLVSYLQDGGKVDDPNYLDQELPVGLRNPKMAPLRAAGHLLSWMLRPESPEEETQRLGLGHSGGLGGFGPGTQGERESRRAMMAKRRADAKRTRREKPGARSMGTGMGGWDLGIMASPQWLFSKPPELGLGWGPDGLGGFDSEAHTFATGKREPYKFMQERGRGFKGYNRGGLFKQAPWMSGDSVRGARTTLSNREKRLTPSSARNPGGFGKIVGPRKGGWFLPSVRSRIGRQLSGDRGTRYNVSEAQRKEMIAAQNKYVWDSIHARDAREREERRSGKSKPPMLGKDGLQRIGFFEFPKDSSGKRNFNIRGGKELMEIIGAMGSVMRQKWGTESPAEKTGRMGFGHSGGYGGMKDPRWGMGGADYKFMQERGKGFKGYNRGGAVMGDVSGFPFRNPKTAPLRAAGHLLGWMLRESEAEKTERLGLGHSGGFGGFGAPRPAKARGVMGGRTAKGRAKGFGAYNRGGLAKMRRRGPGFADPMPKGIGGWSIPTPFGDLKSPQFLFSKPPEPGLGHSGGFGGFGPLPEHPYKFMQERGKGFKGYNRGGNVDSVPAMLTPGEFVMRRESVQKYGERFMNDVNLQKLNNGGRSGPPVGGTSVNVGKTNDLEKGAQLAADSIIGAFAKGAQMVGDAIRAALAPENLAAQLGGVVGQKMKESIAATSIEMKGNMGVDVRLSGNGATGDQAKKTQSTIKNAIASAFNSRTNVDGSSKDPSISQPNSGA